MREVGNQRLLFECSGRKFYAMKGVIGLCCIGPEGSEFDIAYIGFDDRLLEEDADDNVFSRLSVEERTELANHMIARWQAWRDTQSAR